MCVGSGVSACFYNRMQSVNVKGGYTVEGLEINIVSLCAAYRDVTAFCRNRAVRGTPSTGHP